MGSSPGLLGRVTSKLTGVLGKRRSSDSPAPRGRSITLMRNRSFQLLFFGQSLSTLGDRALIIAFGIWVRELTGSNAAAGGSFFFVALPYLFAPFAGVIIDRLPRRLVFIVANLAMAAILLLTLLVHSAGQVWLIYLITFFYGISGIVIDPTQSVLVADIVKTDDLASANGLLQASSDGVRLLAPLIGAALFVVIGGHDVALLDAGTFLVAAGCAWLMRLPVDGRRPTEGSEAEPTQAESLREEMLAGLRHVSRTPALRALVIALGTALLVTGFTQTLNFAIVSSGLHRTAAFVGVLVSAQGVGAIAAGLSAGRATKLLGDGRVVTIGIAGIALAAVIYLAPYVATVILAAALFGAGICWSTVGMVTMVQHRTPSGLQGRALTATMGIASAPQTISIALGAALSLVVNYRILLGIVAVVNGLSAFWLARQIAADQSDSQPVSPSGPPASPQIEPADSPAGPQAP
ncbi:MAG TPA: MFS transporter [Streptosporangiaceae bacterium]|nr:MFS transporter [Streptosporangiaceae bacterium]